jgi:spermidine/putrescine transport system permease protein
MTPTTQKRRSLSEYLLTLPALVWLLVFFIVPALIVFVLACKPADPLGGVASGWTFVNLQAVLEIQYLPILWRTLWMGGLTSLICLGLALPMAYAMARAQGVIKHLLLLLVIIPFWTNFLIRVFAWKSLLHPEGPASLLLKALNLLPESSYLLYNNGAVLLVMVYTQLPFAILPLYAAAEKFDFHLLEAGRDLGASSWQSLREVFLPGISRGLGAAGIMVFVCTLGMYVIPDLVGGTQGELLGNKIAQRVGTDRNLPLAAALSSIMLGTVVLLLSFGVWWRRRKLDRFEPKEVIL